MPLDEMSESLASMLTHIHQSLLSQKNITRVHLSILAHHSPSTHCLHQAHITNDTPLSQLLGTLLPIFGQIQDIVHVRSEQATHKSSLLEHAATSQLDAEGLSPPSLSLDRPGGDRVSGREGSSFPDSSGCPPDSLPEGYLLLESVCEGLHFHLNLLPEEACPVAVFITSGVLASSSLSSISKDLSKAGVSLHVLVLSVPLTPALGCVQDIESLRLVAESSGGSLEMSRGCSQQPANLESFGRIFLRPFYAHRSNSGEEAEGLADQFGDWCPTQVTPTPSLPTSPHIFPGGGGGKSSALLRERERASGLKMQEERLQAYQLEGATMEHIVAARTEEGFRILSISEEREGGRAGSGHMSSIPHLPPIFITIRLEKHISKVCTLVYELSFWNSREPRGGSDTGGVMSSTRNCATHLYTTGLLSVDITNICPYSRITKQKNNGSSRASYWRNQARDIFEGDKRVACFLGQPGMPGHVHSSRSCGGDIRSSTSLEARQNPEEEGIIDSDTYEYKQRQSQREHSFQWSRYHAKLLSDLAAAADLVEEVCRLDAVVRAHIYLRALILLTNIMGSVRCRDRIFANIKKTLPKAFFHSLGPLRWLCLIPTLANPNGGTRTDRASTLGKDSPHLRATPANSSPIQMMFTYEVLIIDIKQIASVFVEVRISGLGSARSSHHPDLSGGPPSGADVSKVTECIVKSLKSLDFDPIVLRRNLSNIAVTPLSMTSRNPFKKRRALLKACHLESVCHFTEVVIASRSLMESLVSDICRSKIAMGFQVMSCITTGTPLAVELCLCAVLSSCPSGVPTDSLIQCTVEASSEGILTTYLWEPSSGKSACNHVGISARMVDPWLGHLMGDKYGSKQLLGYVRDLITQDNETHNFYSALSLIYTYGCVSCAKASPRFSSSGSSCGPAVMSLSREDWTCLCSYSSLFVSELPSFSTKFYPTSCSLPPSQAPSPALSGDSLFLESGSGGNTNTAGGGDQRRCGEESFFVIEELKKLLFLSMTEYIGLSNIEITSPREGEVVCDAKSSFSCCLPMRDGVFMIEVQSSDEGVIHDEVNNGRAEGRAENEHGICSPVPRKALPHDVMLIPEFEKSVSVGRDEASVSPVLSVENDMDEYEEVSEEGGAVESSCERVDSTTPGEDFVRGTNTVHCSSSGKLILEYRYLSVPVNTLFADASMTQRSQQCVLATSAANSASHAPPSPLADAHCRATSDASTSSSSTSRSTASSSGSQTQHSQDVLSSVPVLDSTADCVDNITAPPLDAKSAAASKVSCLPLAMRKQLKKLLDDVDMYNRCNFVLVLYTGLRNKSIQRIHPMDLALALDSCSKESLEVDVTTLCRVKRLASVDCQIDTTNVGSDLGLPVRLSLPPPNLFRSTVGRSLTAIAHSDCFLFSPDSGSSGIPMLDSVYRIALFVKITVIRKAVPSVESAASGDQQVGEVITVPATHAGLSQVLQEVAVGRSMTSDSGDELFDESVLLRLECLSASATDMTSPSAATPSATHPDPPSCVPSLASLQSAFRSSLIRRLTAELQNYATLDTLHSLLLVPNVNAETLILAQHSLRETKGVTNSSHVVDFLTPPNHNQSNFADALSVMMEEELLRHVGLKKIGAIFYLRGFALPGEEISEEAQRDLKCLGEVRERPGEEVWVPCWILLTIAQCSSVAADVTAPPTQPAPDESASNVGPGITDDMSITSMELLMTLRTIGDHEHEQASILKKLCEFVDNCACRVNQFTLLKEMHETRVASSYLISDCAVTNSKPKTQLKSGLLSSSRKDHRRYIGGQRVYDDPGEHKTVIIPTFKFPGVVGEGGRVSESVVVEEAGSDEMEAGIAHSDGKEKVGDAGAAVSAVSLESTAVSSDPEARTTQKDSLSSWRSFRPGHFACPRQGVIHCILPRTHAAALLHDQAIRQLEDSAMHPFALTNLRSCFAYQNRDGHLYYMAFEPSADREERKVSLVVFGLFPIEADTTKHIQDLLETKIIEQVAKVISVMCLRQKKLQISDLQFVKSSGISRHVNLTYKLPPFVSDIYYFLTIVKQTFDSSHVFCGNEVLELQDGEASNHVKSVDLVHPASFGYLTAGKAKNGHCNEHAFRVPLKRKRVAKDALFDCSSSDSDNDSDGDFDCSSEGAGEREFVKLAHHGIQRPFLERKGHVGLAVPLKRTPPELSSAVISPVFFPKHMRRQCPRGGKELERTGSSSSVLWQQKDFTFLYSHQSTQSLPSMGPGEKGQSRIGQGLALLELEPVVRTWDPSANAAVTARGRLLSSWRGQELRCVTGSLASLLGDAESLVRHLQRSSSSPLPALAPIPGLSDPTEAFSTPQQTVQKFTRGNVRDGCHTFLNARASVSPSSHGRRNPTLSPSSHVTPSDTPVYAINLRIYPTFPMNTTGLVEHCSACLTQALEVYCMERIYSASRSGLEESLVCESGNSDDACLNRHFPQEDSASAPSLNTLRNTAVTSTITMADLFAASHQLLSSLARPSSPSPSTGTLSESGLFDIPFSFPKTVAIELHDTIMQAIFQSHPHLRSTAVSPCSLSTDMHIGCLWSSGQREGDILHQELEWLDHRPSQLRVTPSHSCSLLLGDHFISSSVHASDQSFIPSQVSGVSSTPQITPDSSDSISAVAHPTASTKDVEGVSVSANTQAPIPDMRCFSDYKPSCGDMETELFPPWLRKRHYSLEVTIAPSGIRVAYFNILSQEVRRVLDVVSEHVHGAMKRMQEVQIRGLASLGMHRSLQFGQTHVAGGGAEGGGKVEEDDVHGGRAARPQPSSNPLSNLLQSSLTQQLPDLPLDEVSSPSSSISSAELTALQDEISGLFWSQRVLSRLHAKGSRASASRTGAVELRGIPRELWCGLGVGMSDFCCPLTAVPVPHLPVGDSGQGEGGCETRESSSAKQEEGEKEGYFLCLCHLLKSHECIVVGPPARGPADLGSTTENSADSSAALADYESCVIILPLPRTSTLCVLEVGRMLVPPSTGASASTGAAREPNWLIVSQRAVDVSDVVHKVAAHHCVHSSLLLSSAAEDSLLFPSLLSSPKGVQDQGDQPVMSSLREHPSVRRVAQDVLFAALGSLFFFPPRQCHAEGLSEDHSAPSVVRCSQVQEWLSLVEGGLSQHLLCSEDMLELPGRDGEGDGWSDELPRPRAVDVIDSFTSSLRGATADGGGVQREEEEIENQALCFRFVMNKTVSDSEQSDGVVGRGSGSDDEFGFYGNHIFGVCFLQCTGCDSSLTLSYFLFEGSHICGEAKHLANNPRLLRHLRELRESKKLTSLHTGSEEEMLQAMQHSISQFCRDMVSVFYNRAAWMKLLDSSLDKEVVSPVAMPSAAASGGVTALCMGGHQVLLPLATIFAFSHTRRLMFLDFLKPSLTMFRSVQSALFLYNLFVKAFNRRAFMTVPHVPSGSGVASVTDAAAVRFIISGECRINPHFVLINISQHLGQHPRNADGPGASQSDGVFCGDVSVSLVEARGEHDMGDDGASCGMKAARATIESVVDIVLYAANSLLSQW